MVNKKDAKAKASKGEENENVTATVVDETDSSNTVTTTQAQAIDRNQSDDAIQSSDTPPPESDNKDEEKEISHTEETAPDDKKTQATPGSNETFRVKEDEKKRDGEITPKPANTSNAPPLVIPGYFYPVLFLCIFPLVFMAGFYYLKRRK